MSSYIGAEPAAGFATLDRQSLKAMAAPVTH